MPPPPNTPLSAFASSSKVPDPDHLFALYHAAKFPATTPFSTLYRTSSSLAEEVSASLAAGASEVIQTTLHFSSKLASRLDIHHVTIWRIFIVLSLILGYFLVRLFINTAGHAQSTIPALDIAEDVWCEKRLSSSIWGRRRRNEHYAVAK